MSSTEPTATLETDVQTTDVEPASDTPDTKTTRKKPSKSQEKPASVEQSVHLVFTAQDPILTISPTITRIYSENNDGYYYKDVYTLVRLFDGDSVPLEDLIEVSSIIRRMTIEVMDAVRRHCESLSLDTTQNYEDLLEADVRDAFNIYRDEWRLPKRQGEARIVVRARYGFHLPGGGSFSMSAYEHSDPFELFKACMLSIRQMRIDERTYNEARAITDLDLDDELAEQPVDEDGVPYEEETGQAEPQADYEEESPNAAAPDDVPADDKLDPFDLADPNVVIGEVVLEYDEQVIEVEPGLIFDIPIRQIKRFKNRDGDLWRFWAITEASYNQGKAVTHNPMKDGQTLWVYAEDCPAIQQAIDIGVMEDLLSGKVKALKLLVTAAKIMKVDEGSDEEYETFEIYSIQSDVAF